MNRLAIKFSSTSIRGFLLTLGLFLFLLLPVTAPAQGVVTRQKANTTSSQFSRPRAAQPSKTNGGKKPQPQSRKSSAVDKKKTVTQSSATSVEDSTSVFEVRESLPTFPGGEIALNAFIARNLVYPQTALSQRLEGIVLVSFKVNVDGTVGNIKVVRSLSPECDAAAIEVFRKLPRFIPAMQGGRPVPFWFRMPVSFRISD